MNLLDFYKNYVHKLAKALIAKKIKKELRNAN